MVEGLPLQHLTKGMVPAAWNAFVHSTELKICGERPRCNVARRCASLLLKHFRVRLSSSKGRFASANRPPDAYDPGDFSGEATPVPIPNTEVKLSSAEDTERAAFRENRSSPGFLR